MDKANQPSFCSNLFLWWTRQYTNLQNQEIIKQYDIKDLNKNQSCQVHQKRWKQFWDLSYQLDIQEDRLKWSLKKAFSYEIYTCLIINFFSYQLNALIPVFIYFLSQYIKGQTKIDQSIIYLFILIFLKLIRALCHMQGQFRLKMLGNKIFSCLGLAVTQKALKNLDFSKKFYSPAEQAKIMQYDCARILDYPFILVSASFQIYMSVFTIASVTYLIGWVGFISCVFLFCFQTSRYAFGSIFRKYQKLVNQRTSQRILKTTQVINNIKYIKVNAYQQHFFYMIQNLRFLEIDTFRFLLNLKLIPMFFNYGGSRFAIFVFTAIGILQGITINAAIVFSVLLFYNYMALNSFIDHINTIQEGQISLRKIEQFLDLNERDISFIRNSLSDESNKSQRSSIHVENGNFYWQIPKQDNSVAVQQGYSIKNVNFQLKKGQFVTLVGSFGSGKTSIILSLFGEMQNSGHSKIYINGTIAYADQRPWIMNDTVRNNILFGEPFDDDRYRKTIKYSCMEKDLAMFTQGQDTMIGQGGSTISGGQRARISLARALYKNADIYILDDILSAVDAHVSAFIFKETLLKYLKGKSIILATHLLNYLYLTDRIFMIQNGQINQILDGNDSQLPILARKSSNRQSYGVKKESAPPLQVISQPEKISVFSVNQDQDLTYTDYINLYIRKNGGNSYIVFIVLYVLFISFTGALALTYLNTWMNSNDIKNAVHYYIFLGIVISRSLATIIYGLIEHNSSLFMKLHFQMLNKIIKAPMSFFETTPQTQITNRLSTDLKKVDNEVMSKFRNILFTLSIALSLLFNIINVYISRGQYVFLFLIIVTLIIMIASYAKYMQALRKIHKLQHECEIPVSSNFSEIVSGAVTIRAYNKVQFITRKQINFINTFSKVYKATVGIDSHFTFLITLLTSSIAVIVFIKILLLESTHAVDFFILYNAFSFEKSTLTFHVAFFEFVHNIKHIKHCEDVLNIDQEDGFDLKLKMQVYQRGNSSFNIQHNGWIKRGKIQFKNFCVRYRPELNPVLDGISFTIKENQKIGVVGRTGSGKSTTLLSLLRILQQHEGLIQVDEQDIYKLDIQTLRSGFSTILQQHYLFSGNVRDNIDPLHKFTDEQVNKALKLCGLYDSIKGRQGLDTIIEQNGDNFSAGEKQLINISRTLLNPKKVVLVDQATASIDYKSDQILQKVLKSEFKNVTMVTIAHRIETILESDRIMVLDKGKLQQFDSPKKLLQNPASLFYQLHQQSQKPKDAL